MRKVIKRPDGTEEVVEGTAEEIAEYERQIREGSRPRTKKPPVLRGAEVDGKPLTDEEIVMLRAYRLGILPQKEYVPQPYPVYPITPLMPYLLERPCGFCGVIGCRQTHVWCETITVTSDSTVPQNKAYLVPGQLTVNTVALGDDAVLIPPSYKVGLQLIS